MSYTHLTIEDRIYIGKMYSSGKSIRMIGRLFNRSAATISTELKLYYSHTGIYAGYFPSAAQKKHHSASINKCNKFIYKSKEFGHWEGDTVVSSRGKSKNCFATLVERKSLLFLAAIIKIVLQKILQKRL